MGYLQAARKLVGHLGRRQGAPAGPRMHRLCILRHWLAPNGCCRGITCQNSDRRSVPRSVGGLHVYDSGPDDPRPLHPDPRCKPTLDQRLRGLGESLPWINDVEGASGALGGAYLAPTGMACGPLDPLPCPLASYMCICHHFGQNSCIQIYFQVQVELGEL